LPGALPKAVNTAGIGQNHTQKRCRADRVRPDNLDESSPEALAADQVFRDELASLIPSLRAFARGLCGRRDLADDLAQDAMMCGWAARSSFAPGTNFRAWMFRIARNRFYNSIRRDKIWAGWDPDWAEHALVEAPAQQHAIHLADVLRALGKLPAEQREVLLLVGANGVPYEEAAEIVGCAIGTVKSRLARGRTALALLIDEPAGEARFEKAA
jgi:RNA polymerase sigma-70 factor (ECF subfamily)